MLISPAYAQDVTGMFGSAAQFMPLVLIFVVFYFLLIRPQQQRQKQADQMLKALKKGDRVVTTGGIIGTVIGIDDAKATLRIAEDTKVEFTKSSIVQVLTVGEGK